jgi:hypothetical protein
MRTLIEKLKALGIYAVSGIKYRFEWTVWLPVLGLLSMLYYTEFGRYRTIYFAGQIWQPYQLICFMGTLLLCATYCH